MVDPAYHLIGSVAFNRLLRAKRTGSVRPSPTAISIRSGTSRPGEVARQFERYNLTSAPVIQDDRRLVGVITADDVVESCRRRLRRHSADGRRGGKSVSNSVWQTTRLRFTWLLANLVTAILASAVISLFEATVEQMVALAVLMPIVASMGGNAGTQTMRSRCARWPRRISARSTRSGSYGEERRSACSTGCCSR